MLNRFAELCVSGEMNRVADYLYEYKNDNQENDIKYAFIIDRDKLIALIPDCPELAERAYKLTGGCYDKLITLTNTMRSYRSVDGCVSKSWESLFSTVLNTAHLDEAYRLSKISPVEAGKYEIALAFDVK